MGRGWLIKQVVSFVTGMTLLGIVWVVMQVV